MSDIDVFADGFVKFDGKTYRCALGKGGVGAKRGEGDNITPVGVYKLGRVFYRSDRLSAPKTALPIQATNPNDGWCDDPADKDHYNQLVTLPHSGGYEDMWRTDEAYNIVVVIEYNTDPVEIDKGSAIFIHVARPNYSPTAGCVALSQSDLIEILERANLETRIVINQQESK